MPDDLGRATWRLALQIGALLLGSVAAVAGIVVLTVVNSQQTQAVSLLHQAIEATHGGAAADSDSDDARVRNVSIAVTDPRGTRIVGVMPAGLPDRAVMAEVARTRVTDQRTVRAATGHYAVRTEQRGDDTVQAVLNLHEQRDELERLLQALLLAGSTGILLAALAAAWLARRAVRPIADALVLQRRFVADASHELRTPLTLLSTRAQLLARRVRRDPGGPVDAAVLADADGLVADAGNLTEILEDLLLAADTRTPVPMTPVDLTDLAREALAAAEAYARERQVELSVIAPRPASVEAGARSALLRAMTALLDNAISHAERTVTLGVEQEGAAVLVRVMDDGPGIAEEALPTMFSRFASHRLGEANVQRRHYGLGLALVADVVARHGGTLVAANRTDGQHGAVLTIRLPRGAR